MNNSIFKNTFADAFDGDFVTGEMNDCSFIDCGNDGIDVSGESVTVWFGEFSQTLVAGLLIRNDDEERFEFEADAAGVTELSIQDDGSFRLIARDNHLATMAFEFPVRFSLHIGNDAGATMILLNEEGRFGLIE